MQMKVQMKLMLSAMDEKLKAVKSIPTKKRKLSKKEPTPDISSAEESDSTLEHDVAGTSKQLLPYPTYETDNEEEVEHDVEETTDDFTSEQGSTSQEEDAQSSVPEEPESPALDIHASDEDFLS